MHILRAGTDHFDQLCPLFSQYRGFFEQVAEPESERAYLQNRKQQNAT